MSTNPPSWVRSTVGAVLPVRYGKAAPRTDEGTVPVVASAGTIRHTAEELCHGPSLIVGRKGGVGRVQLVNGPVWPTDTTYYISVPEAFSAKFLYYQMSSIGLERLDRSTAVPSLQRPDLESASICIPPRAEQERIVAAIEEQFSRIDAGVTALDGVRQNLKRMRAAVLQSAVTGNLVPHSLTEDVSAVLQRVATERRAAWAEVMTKLYKEPARADPFPLATIPAHWRIASLEALTDPIRVICYGILMPKGNIEDGIPYVRVRDMKGWAINVAGLKRTSREIADQYARASLRPGDLLLAIRGSYGRVAIVPSELDGANITQDSARIAVHDCIDHRYLLYYLGGSVANRYYHRVARGVAVKGVNIGDLRSMPVPVPPHDEQVAIADEVERHFTLMDQVDGAVDTALRSGRSLRSSILAAAFSGKLVDQDPADESAAILLGHIVAERVASNGRKIARGRIPRSKVTA